MRVRFASLTLLAILLFPRADGARAVDPAPPATFHAPPKPLPPDAVTSDWPRFLGPADAARSPETRLSRELPTNGPPVVWEAPWGEGYASPVVVGDRVVLFHRVAEREAVECRDAGTGRPIWRHDWPVEYRDRFNYNNGPRGSPTVAGGRVHVFGVTGRLFCLELKDGAVRWHRDLRAQYGISDNFFGLGSSPLVHDGCVIVNAGGSEGRAVVALDEGSGEPRWVGRSDWGNSYASPIAARIMGRETIIVFAGGESDPPAGGLLCLDPSTGATVATFPWRAKRFHSVNASTPVVLGPDTILLSESYDRGSVAVRVAAGRAPVAAWVAPRFRLHFMTPVLIDGHLYGIDGEHRRNAALVCLDAVTGAERWREEVKWPLAIGEQTVEMGIYRGNLLAVDGRVLCLGELGALLWLDLSPKGCRVLARAQLFLAQETWSPPALSRGLLYVTQNAPDLATGIGPRLLCYDLRAGTGSPAPESP